MLLVGMCVCYSDSNYMFQKEELRVIRALPFSFNTVVYVYMFQKFQ